MAISGVVQSGVQGFQKAVSGVEGSAQQIASATTSSGESLSSSSGLVQPMIEMKLYELNAQASAKVVETGDKILGSLLDAMA